MERKALAIVLAVPISAVGLACPSSANTDRHGAYHQGTGRFHCTGQVQGDGDGSRIFVEVRGREIRPENEHFRTARVKTRLIAEEKAYDSSWDSVERSRKYRGRLGAAWDNGATNVSPFRWNMKRPSDGPALPVPIPVPLPADGSGRPKHDKSPMLTVRVGGHDDLFRARVVTRVIDDEGALLARLVTREGTCRL